MDDLIAKRSFKYSTRHLVPGDVFQAKTPRDQRLLIAIKRADKAPDILDDNADGEDIAALREAYAEKFGKRAWNGWDAATLREKMSD